MSAQHPIRRLFPSSGITFDGNAIGLRTVGNGPLNFGNNFFVTGDYVVAGAYGLNEDESNGYATGIIAVPDVNPGIQPGATTPALFPGYVKELRPSRAPRSLPPCFTGKRSRSLRRSPARMDPARMDFSDRCSRADRRLVIPYPV